MEKQVRRKTTNLEGVKMFPEKKMTVDTMINNFSPVLHNQSLFIICNTYASSPLPFTLYYKAVCESGQINTHFLHQMTSRWLLVIGQFTVLQTLAKVFQAPL